MVGKRELGKSAGVNGMCLGLGEVEVLPGGAVGKPSILAIESAIYRSEWTRRRVEVIREVYTDCCQDWYVVLYYPMPMLVWLDLNCPGHKLAANLNDPIKTFSILNAMIRRIFFFTLPFSISQRNLKKIFPHHLFSCNPLILLFCVCNQCF